MLLNLPLILALNIVTVFAASKAVSIRPSYTVWCTGNCNVDAVTASEPGVVLMGGGVK